jgi:hypothetical protein
MTEPKGEHMVDEARLEQRDAGLSPATEGSWAGLPWA